MGATTSNPSPQRKKQVGLCDFWGLHSEFQAGQSYIGILCLQGKKEFLFII